MTSLSSSSGTPEHIESLKVRRLAVESMNYGPMNLGAVTTLAYSAIATPVVSDADQGLIAITAYNQAAAATDKLTVTNNRILSVSDVVLAQVVGGGALLNGMPVVWTNTPAIGSFELLVGNPDTVLATSSTLVIYWRILHLSPTATGGIGLLV